MSFLSEYADELAHLKTALDIAFGKGVGSNSVAKEDRVVFPLGVATRNLFEEVVWSVNQGFGRAALRTAGTLYECVVFSLYINKHPETWEGYLNTLYAQWGKVLQNFPEADQKLPAMHKVLAEKVPAYGEGKFISLSWNDDHTTFAMASDVGISELFHSLAFNYTSGFVHPSAMFLLSGFGPNTPDGRLNTTKESEDHFVFRHDYFRAQRLIPRRIKCAGGFVEAALGHFPAEHFHWIRNLCRAIVGGRLISVDLIIKRSPAITLPIQC